MRVAFLGAAHSHPFTDAANLRARGAEIVGVWDDADDNADVDGDDGAARFAARFAVPRLDRLEQALALAPDLLIATPRTGRAAGLAERLADAGIRTFFNKLVAASPAQLARYRLAVARAQGRGTRIETSSVLRFAPRLQELAGQLRGRGLLALNITAQHDIAGFLGAGRAWQDDPADGGGTLLNVGVHAWEMLEVLRPGAAFEPGAALAARSGAPATRSETIGVARGTLDGAVPVQLSIAGVPGEDSYAVEALTASGILRTELAAGELGVELGFVGLVDALLAAVPSGAPVVPDGATDRIYTRMLSAAEAARAPWNGES